MTETPSEFLLARIAEDEAAALPLANADTRAALREGSRGYVEATPARVLAECEAKRRIVEECQMGTSAWPASDKDGYFDTILELLALPYADHPDYRNEWRP